MKIRTRFILAYFLLAVLGFSLLVDWILDDLRPRYLETMEESMVDTATILAAMCSIRADNAGTGFSDLRALFDEVGRRKFQARIYEMTKTNLMMRVYVTDRNGLVLFDSDHGRDAGRDYSKWNDVIRTLRGEYGARATRQDPDDPDTVILYVAAPVMREGKIAGVLTVSKPSASLSLFLQSARRKIFLGGVLAALMVILFGMIVSVWITWPIQKLTAYANAVRDGKRLLAPRLGRSEIGRLGKAFEEMKDALEGKQYVENYVQALTHEMKGPLSSVRGAAELLEEDMPLERRRQFLKNIRAETCRMQDIVERLLELSSLESRKQLQDVESLRLADVVRDAAESVQSLLGSKGLKVKYDADEQARVRAERFLVRQAAANLLQNAAEFSPRDGEIAVSIRQNGAAVELAIRDHGPGIPDYALGRVFERFYSLKKPDTSKKGTGLGLTFVKEAAALHGGEVSLQNCPDGGVCAKLILPLARV